MRKQFYPLRKIFFSLCLVSLLSAAVAEEPAALTLQEAYRLALAHSEDVAAQAELIEEAEGHFYRALGGILPKVHYVITEFRQDTPEASSSESGATSNLLRDRTPQQRFTLSQPLFSGFKEFAAMQSTGAEKKQRRHEKKRAEELLFVDVSEAFYGWLQAQKDLEIVEEIRTLLNERVRELRGRADIGRSRESEIQTALVDLRLAGADREEVAQAVLVWRHLLEFYIGRPLTTPLLDEELPKTFLAPPLNYAAAVKNRSDVMAAKETYVVTDKNVGVATAGLFPSVSLDGNYYTERVGVQKDIEWDVLFTIDIPIFEGTEVIGDIKSAAAQRGAAKQALSKAEREAARDAEDSYLEWRTALRREKVLQAAMLAAKENGRFQIEEYRNSLVNNLEVLQALRLQEDTARRWNQARYEAKRNYWKFKIARGETVVSKSGEDGRVEP